MLSINFRFYIRSIVKLCTFYMLIRLFIAIAFVFLFSFLHFPPSFTSSFNDSLCLIVDYFSVFFSYSPTFTFFPSLIYSFQGFYMILFAIALTFVRFFIRPSVPSIKRYIFSFVPFQCILFIIVRLSMFTIGLLVFLNHFVQWFIL